MLNNKVILVTGGTGSFGNEFVSMTIAKYKPKLIIIFSRDEMKQWDMAMKYQNNKNIKFVIGDVRDKDRLSQVLKGVDYVIHAAATKIVPTAEYNPIECIKTNVIGAINVAECSINAGVKKIVALSTDKACNPINLYGATKLSSDKLFVASNEINTKFSVVRYGNVMGSRGSVIPFFIKNAHKNYLTITDERMTRFMITLHEAVTLVWHAINEIYVKKIPSMKVVDIALSIAPEAKHTIIGIRPGEKLHEQMIGTEDAPYTYEYKDHYKILPSIHDWAKDKKRIGIGTLVKEDFTYTSDQNTEWMSKETLASWIENHYKK